MSLFSQTLAHIMSTFSLHDDAIFHAHIIESVVMYLKDGKKETQVNSDKRDEDEQIASTVLWSLAVDEKWLSGPTLQGFNAFCMKRKAFPIWGDDAGSLQVLGRTYILPERKMALTEKKKIRKTCLAAMAMMDRGELLPSDWLAHHHNSKNSA